MKIEKIFNIISLVLLILSLISKFHNIIIFNHYISLYLIIGTLIFSGINLLLQGSMKTLLRIMDLRDKRKWVWVNGISFLLGFIIIIIAIWSIINFNHLDFTKLSIVTIITSIIMTSVETFL